MLSGAGAALYFGMGTGSDSAIVEAIGGAIGGYVGGKLPDVIDPPIHPGHRSIGHGVIPVGAVGNYYVENVGAWQEELRRLARECAAAAAECDSDAGRAKYLLLELFFQLAAGFIVGVGAGYASHLAMDLCTPRRLPLLG